MVAFYLSKTHKSARMWLCKHCLCDLVEYIIKTSVVFSIKIATWQKGYVISNYAIVNYVLKRCMTEKDITMLRDELRTSKRQAVTATTLLNNHGRSCYDTDRSTPRRPLRRFFWRYVWAYLVAPSTAMIWIQLPTAGWMTWYVRWNVLPIAKII